MKEYLNPKKEPQKDRNCLRNIDVFFQEVIEIVLHA
jgi:hypothetical protein